MTFASLSEQRILITGSSSGIGRSMAMELRMRGADVVINCRQSLERAEMVASDIRELGRLRGRDRGRCR
jgi:3-oxoacyl-[acyl-carrier protein] reductase